VAFVALSYFSGLAIQIAEYLIKERNKPACAKPELRFGVGRENQAKKKLPAAQGRRFPLFWLALAQLITNYIFHRAYFSFV
jgi:hypothetical protein